MTDPWERDWTKPLADPWERDWSAQSVAAKEAKPDPSIGGGTLRPFGIDTGIKTPQWMDRALAGAGKAFTDTGRGVRQLAGMADQSSIDEAKKLDAPLMDTGMGIAGNVAGQLAQVAGPSAALGAAGKAAQLPMMLNAARAMALPKTIAGAAGQGAALGALQPVASKDSRLMNTGLGAAGGAIGSALPRAVGRVIAPKVSPEISLLMKEGVTPTPGQIMGGAFQRIEEGATSVPIIGDAIKSGQRRAVEDLNRAAVNRSLAPVGEKLSGNVGNDAIEQAAKKIGEHYDALLPKLTATADLEFGKAFAGVNEIAAQLPDDRSRQLTKILQQQLLNKFDDTGTMNGQQLKRAESVLGSLARKYRAGSDQDGHLLADGIQEAQAALRGLVERSNPEHAAELKAANTAWANFVRAQKAASGIGAKEGVFSPAQLRSAVRATDSSSGKSQFGRGNALMQDLADAGEKALGAKLPDSGTPFRTANIAAGLGGAYFNPALLTSAAGISALYSKYGQKALAALLTQRPELAGILGSKVGGMAPYLAAPGAAGLLSQ